MAKLLNLLFCLAQLTVVLSGTIRKEGSTCTVRASTDGSDDAPAILEAFRTCGRNGMIELHDPLYNIDTVMETVGLSNVHIDLTGKLLWSTNITYWRNNSLPLPYQNQTTAWVLGGDNVVFDGHNVGTFDGNGQVWYDFAGSISNLAGRPISLTITNSTNSHYTGIRFVQSQFWSMAVNRSEDILLENIYVNSTSNGRPVQNTDGVDTFYSNRITFRNWTVTNGDDSISFKANSTNMLVQDCTFFLGEGIAIGSIGQMDGVFEFIQNVTVERVLAVGTRFAAYVKTFTGVQQGFPPNGGGGGLGFATNMTFRDFVLQNVTGQVAQITQCTSFEGLDNDCDTSRFQLSNITWGPNITGSITSNTVASLQCSGDAPCPGIELLGLNEVTTAGGRAVDCSNIVNPVGFNCT